MPSCVVQDAGDHGVGPDDLREVDPDEGGAAHMLEVPHGLAEIVELLARLRSVRGFREDVRQLDVAQDLR